MVQGLLIIADFGSCLRHSEAAADELPAKPNGDNQRWPRCSNPPKLGGTVPQRGRRSLRHGAPHFCSTQRLARSRRNRPRLRQKYSHSARSGCGVRLRHTLAGVRQTYAGYQPERPAPHDQPMRMRTTTTAPKRIRPPEEVCCVRSWSVLVPHLRRVSARRTPP